MKTFDIALKYLKGIDFSTTDIFSSEKFIANEGMDKIKEKKKLYDKDPDNTASNDHYRSCVFEVAIYHLMDKAHGRVSCFDVACAIVDENRDSVDTSGGEWKGYPEVMKKHWDKYIEEMDKKPQYLCGEMVGEIIMTAYHFIIDDKS